MQAIGQLRQKKTPFIMACIAMEVNQGIYASK